MAHLEEQFIDCRIARGETSQSALRLQLMLQVLRPFSAGSRIDKIRDRRNRPWVVDHGFRLGLKGLGQRGQWIIRVRVSAKELAQSARLLDGEGHSLAIDRIQAANRVAHGEQPTGKIIEPPEVSPPALRKTV